MPAKLQETDFATGIDPILSALNTDGGVIVHDFIATETLEQFRADVRRAAEQHRYGTASDLVEVQRFWGEKTMRFTRLPLRSTAFFDILAHRDYLAVADATLGPNCTNIWMNTGQMMILAPGQPSQVLHRDADNWPNMNRPNGFEVTLSCMFAIEDFTVDNGATRVVPGSHRWSDYQRRATQNETAQAVMPAGSGMIYSGRVLHGGGANISDNVSRWGLHVSFVLGWLVPEEALPLSAPWETVKDQPERVQQLLGWRCSTIGSDSARLWTVDYEDVPVGLNLL